MVDIPALETDAEAFADVVGGDDATIATAANGRQTPSMQKVQKDQMHYKQGGLWSNPTLVPDFLSTYTSSIDGFQYATKPGLTYPFNSTTDPSADGANWFLIQGIINGGNATFNDVVSSNIDNSGVIKTDYISGRVDGVNLTIAGGPAGFSGANIELGSPSFGGFASYDALHHTFRSQDGLTDYLMIENGKMTGQSKLVGISGFTLSSSSSDESRIGLFTGGDAYHDSNTHYFRSTGAGVGYVTINSSSLFPAVDAARNLGGAGNRWNNFYVVNAPIVGSDIAYKEIMEDEVEKQKVFAAVSSVDIDLYQLKDAINEKGSDKARIHAGIVAQNLEAAFKDQDLDPFRYGVLCKDTYNITEEVEEEYTEEEQLTETVITLQPSYRTMDNGKLVEEMIEVSVEVGVYTEHHLFSANGKPIMINVLNEEGEPNGTQVQKTKRIATMHDAPKLRKKTVNVLNEEGEPVTETRLSVRYEQLAMLMIKALRNA